MHATDLDRDVFRAIILGILVFYLPSFSDSQETISPFSTRLLQAGT